MEGQVPKYLPIFGSFLQWLVANSGNQTNMPPNERECSGQEIGALTRAVPPTNGSGSPT
jgi:hypothetical protein